MADDAKKTWLDHLKDRSTQKKIGVAAVSGIALFFGWRGLSNYGDRRYGRGYKHGWDEAMDSGEAGPALPAYDEED